MDRNTEGIASMSSYQESIFINDMQSVPCVEDPESSAMQAVNPTSPLKIESTLNLGNSGGAPLSTTVSVTANPSISAAEISQCKVDRNGVSVPAHPTQSGVAARVRLSGSAAGMDVDQEDLNAAKAKSAKICHMHPFTPSDFDDLTQELFSTWLRNRHRLDPARGSMRALRTTVLERTAGKLVRNARAQKRNGASVVSLESQGSSQGSGGSAEIGRDRRRPTLDGSRLTAQQEVDLRLDLQKLLSHLPPNLNALCELLKERTVAEISRDLGIPASTVSSQVSLIRQRFESSKFRDLL